MIHSAADNERAAGYKGRIGLGMFLLYAVSYAGFIAVNTLWPRLMEASFGGLNLAILYGFALLVLAFVVAALYDHCCTRAEKRCAAEP